VARSRSRWGPASVQLECECHWLTGKQRGDRGPRLPQLSEQSVQADESSGTSRHWLHHGVTCSLHERVPGETLTMS